MAHFSTRLTLMTLPALLLMACATSRPVIAQADPGVQGEHAAIGQQMVLASYWLQQSAEAQALLIQGYNMARMALEHDLSLKIAGKRAVVLDIDETVLDNSPYQVRCIQDGIAYPTGWKEWCAEASARVLPGAREFLEWADSKGVAIFYISNRKHSQMAETLQNLREKGLPQAEESHLLLKQEDNSKENRRRQVAAEYRVAVLLGDNLADFAADFDQKSVEGRREAVEANAHLFGTRFILLPNPSYGDWEAALYEYNWSLDDSTRMARRVQALRRD
jgi:5'-nucleotidase (lipoprotein e(P4) family)